MILRTVAAADRRLRIARYLRDLVVRSTLVLSVALALLILAHVLPVSPAWAFWGAAAGVLAFAALQAWRLARQPAPGLAASRLDRAARLGDELVSAHWFAGRASTTPWLDFHLRRASVTAAALDVARLLPIAVPRRAAKALALVLAVFIGVSLVPVGWTRTWVSGGAPAALTLAERARLDDIERLLARDDAGSPERVAAKARIDELLRRLRAGGLSPDETLALVEELRQLIGAAAGSGAALGDALARTGNALATAAMTEDVGEAMRRQQADEASRRMRELASAVEQAMRNGATLEGLQATLSRAAALAQGGLDRLAGDLAGAASDVSRGQAEDAKASLDRAADDLDAAAEIQEFEQALRNANQQLDDLARSLGSRFGPSREAGQAAQRAEAQALASSDVSPQGAAPQPGEGPGRPVPGEAGEQQSAMVTAANQPGSSAPGPLGAPGLTAAGAPGRIDVARRREALPVEPPPGDPPRERLVDEETHATRATVPYRPVATTPPYDGAERLTPDEVPASYRDLVKSYFRLLGPRGKKDER